MKKYEKWRNIFFAAEGAGMIAVAAFMVLNHIKMAMLLLIAILIFAIVFMGFWNSLKRRGIEASVDISRVLGKDAKEALIFGDVGILTYNDEYVCTWCSDYFREHHIDILNKKLTTWIENIRDLFEGEMDTITGRSGNQFYEIQKKENSQVLFARNITELVHLRHATQGRDVVIGQLILDNYNEYQAYEDEEMINEINTQLRGVLINWAKTNGMFLRRLRGDRFLVIFDKAILDRVRADNFRILQTIKDKADKLDVSITLSMGFVYGTENFVELDTMLNELLELIAGRGGDQAAIKKCGEPVEFIGSSSEKTSGRSKVRVRIMAESIEDLIKESGKVFILGHVNTDYDSMGSALAASAWAKSLRHEPYIVLKDIPRDGQLQETMDHYSKSINERHNFVTEEEAMRIFNPEKDLILMVDHGTPAISSGQEMLAMPGRRVVVIDHHRRSEDFVEAPLLAYVESTASSVSELLTELLQASSTTIPIYEAEATLMYLGLLVDTNRFKTHTSERTFQAAGTLSGWGASNSVAEQALLEDYESFHQRNEIIANAHRVLNRFMVAVSEEPTNRTRLAQAAEYLTRIKGVEAAFVIGVNENNGRTAMSARSNGSYNVQKIAEQLGGGGHFAAAALEKADITPKQLEHDLIEVLKKEEESHE